MVSVKWLCPDPQLLGCHALPSGTLPETQKVTNQIPLAFVWYCGVCSVIVL